MARRSSVKYKDYEVRGWVCKKCKKEYIHPEDSLKISKLEALKKGETVGLVPGSLKKIEIEL